MVVVVVVGACAVRQVRRRQAQRRSRGSAWLKPIQAAPCLGGSLSPLGLGGSCFCSCSKRLDTLIEIELKVAKAKSRPQDYRPGQKTELRVSDGDTKHVSCLKTIF